MKKLFGVLRSKGVAISSAVSAAALVASVNVHAALPAWATTMPADIDTRVKDVEAAVGPLVIGVLIAVIGVKLIKRFANKI